MSIFNASFPEPIKNELYTRQDKLLSRIDINTLIQSTAWIRMSSGVNVLKPDAIPTNGEYLNSDFDNTLAKNNVLLNTTNTESSFIKGYTTGNRHGIRPVPGIVNLDCQSFSPNGSLRKVTVKFNCWDMSQLEILEQLYMRPGYLICVEWGWTHQLGNGDKLNLPNFGEKFIENNKEFSGKTLMELYDIANEEVKSVNGNYDICIGKVQNFNWNVRKDMGYDCEVTIITFGEILDSWKLNNVDYTNSISKMGIPLGNNVNLIDEEGVSKYVEGKLCGILNDLNNYLIKEYQTSTATTAGQTNKLITNNIIIDDVVNLKTCITNFSNDIIPNDAIKLSKTSNLTSYITLGSLCNLLNYYMLNSNILNLTSETFMCQAHPFQLPCDPNICLIKPQGWIDGIAYSQGKEDLNKAIEPGIKPENEKYNLYIENILKAPSFKSKYENFLNLLEIKLKNNDLEKSLLKIQNNIESKINLNNINYNPDATLTFNFINSNFTGKTVLGEDNQQYINLYNLLGLDLTSTIETRSNNTNIDSRYNVINNIEIFLNILNSTKYAKPEYSKLNYPLIIKNLTGITYPNEIRNNDIGGIDLRNNRFFINKENVLNSAINKKRKLSDETNIAIKQSQFKNINEVLTNRFKDLEDFFVEPKKNNYRKGNISNIYLNLNYLYSLIKPNEVNSNDKNNKNEITLNNFIRDILTKVQNSLGSLNSFEIFADPIDNVAKIIDKDYIDLNEIKPEDVFRFNFDHDKSLILNHNIKSQIFPEQSTIIAISTQAPSAKLGLNNTGLIQYNQMTRNRFVELNSPNDIKYKVVFDSYDINNPLYMGVSHLSFYVSLLKFINDDSVNVNVNFSALNNSLRDLITYWDSNHSENAYKSMPLPIVISLEFLGIAGIRIGNIFNIEGGSKNILPASVGDSFNFLVRNISQTINNNKWIVNIEGYPFKN